MHKHTSIGRKLAGLAAGAGMVAVSLTAMTTPAQAYSPNPDPAVDSTKTGDCPCRYGDVIDGTYFKKDKGGQAVKIGLWDSGNYVGKVEFHPYGEHLYIYDNQRDGDSFYVTLAYYGDDGRPVRTGPMQAGTTMDDIHSDLSYDEGERITVSVYDSDDPSDHITSETAIA